MRLLPLAAIGLLAATVLTASPAAADGEACQGRTATIVGTPAQPDLTGTEGDDVVVTNGASRVSTLGGADLVCVTGPNPSTQMSLDTGAGDDVVDASASTSGVAVRLGSGGDTYTGSTGLDSVSTGPEGETDRDAVQMGSGSSWSGVASGTYGSDLPNPDVIVLGSNGGSVSWFGPMAPGARVDGGGAGSRLATDVAARNVVLDATARTLIEDGATTLTWTGFDSFHVVDRGAPESFTFAGSDRNEQLTVEFDDAHTGRQRVDLGGGDDTRTSFTGFDTQLLGARKLVLKGTRKADELRFYACKATVRGRAGADDIAQSRGDDYFEAGLRCNPRKFRLFGDKGNDRLRGSTANDLLIGGRGRDTINGNGGRDRCSGEKLTSCEVGLR